MIDLVHERRVYTGQKGDFLVRVLILHAPAFGRNSPERAYLSERGDVQLGGAGQEKRPTPTKEG
jgi:hypothetical protein